MAKKATPEQIAKILQAVDKFKSEFNFAAAISEKIAELTTNGNFANFRNVQEPQWIDRYRSKQVLLCDDLKLSGNMGFGRGCPANIEIRSERDKKAACGLRFVPYLIIFVGGAGSTFRLN